LKRNVRMSISLTLEPSSDGQILRRVRTPQGAGLQEVHPVDKTGIQRIQSLQLRKELHCTFGSLAVLVSRNLFQIT
jgi:hypothetical protein